MPSTAPDRGAPLSVAVGVIRDARGRVLLARRPAHLHQGGRWEFPGGKREPGEGRFEALRRELEEELGIRVRAARPWLRVEHRYPDRAVRLDVWRVLDFEGRPEGREGQAVEWVPVADLDGRDFPEANRSILRALSLPGLLLITPAPGDDPRRFLEALERSLADGVSLVQLRAPDLDAARLAALARPALALCRCAGARLVLNGPAGLARELGVDGVHLNSRRLAALRERPLPHPLLLGASCHDARQLARARALGADYALLSPVRATDSHPGATPLGWDGFAALARDAGLPVYALGGLGRGDLERARAAGAQGVAAIRGLWRVAP